MTAQRVEERGGAAEFHVSAAVQPEIARRALQLCRGAEPHGGTVPCRAHLHEAQRQLLTPAL